MGSEFNRIRRLVKQFLDQQPDFRKATELNPLHIFSLSHFFKQLDIKNENVLIVSKSEEAEDISFILTDKKLHAKHGDEERRLTFADFLKLGESDQRGFLQNCPKSSHAGISKLVHDIHNGESDTIPQRDLDGFVKKFKSFVDQKTDANQDFSLDLDFLEMLQDEGDRVDEICERLGADKQFLNALQSIFKSEVAVSFKVEHIFLQDLIKTFNNVTGIDGNPETLHVKAKFILAYFFERLQGKDMLTSLTIERINDLASSEKFDENIDKISKAQFIQLDDSYRNEYVLPSILKRIDSLDFEPVGSFLYRIASLIAKVDGNVSDEEKKRLKTLLDKVSQPKQKIEGVSQTEVDADDTLEKVMGELNNLIGLNEIKRSMGELANFLKVQKMREKEGLKTSGTSLHSVFIGPPGTGKTTIARLVGRIYKHLGYLEKGHIVETDRAGMVAGYVGQTAIKVDELLKAAEGGVLFIDEAYSLAKPDNPRDFGHEAVEILLKRMEDGRSNLVVIAAGYPDEMKNFIQSNPGLQSRFNRYFNFDHYSPDELLRIMLLFVGRSDFKMDEDAEEKVLEILDRLYEKKHKSFGNARVVRNLFEMIIGKQANRIVDVSLITKEVLISIKEEDVPPIKKTVDQFILFEEEEAADEKL